MLRLWTFPRALWIFGALKGLKECRSSTRLPTVTCRNGMNRSTITEPGTRKPLCQELPTRWTFCSNGRDLRCLKIRLRSLTTETERMSSTFLDTSTTALGKNGFWTHPHASRQFARSLPLTVISMG
ncbi:hypothetical protein C8R45DRAFT_1040310 [Mycena sanguinolenta]|nr:hypothetical protein C8R45DRAFT_1040310 [Mycena sanguinolenta]